MEAKEPGEADIVVDRAPLLDLRRAEADSQSSLARQRLGIPGSHAQLFTRR
jgi:hypothetical protein